MLQETKDKISKSLQGKKQTSEHVNKRRNSLMKKSKVSGIYKIEDGIIYYQGYLTEDLIAEILDLKKINYSRNKGFIHNKRFRPDFVLEDQKLVIEFDGPQHFTNSSIAFKDISRDKFFKSCGYDVLRIPYYEQMTPVNLRMVHNPIFGNVRGLYQSGFVETEVLPASFCALGVKRFEADLKFHNEEMVFEIMDTLLFKKYLEQLHVKELVPNLKIAKILKCYRDNICIGFFDKPNWMKSYNILNKFHGSDF